MNSSEQVLHTLNRKSARDIYTFVEKTEYCLNRITVGGAN